MLKKLRKKKTSKKILIALAFIIIPAFAFWGFGNAIRSQNKSQYAGKINGKKISHAEFQDALQAIRNLAIIQYGNQFSEVQRSLNLEPQAWDRLILLYEARARRIQIPDKDVIEAIEAYPFFHGKNKFDQTIYNQMLEYVFRTPARVFEEQLRQNLMIAKLFQEVTDKTKLADEEALQEYRKANEGVSIAYLASIPADFAKKIPVTDEELKNYYQKDSLRFKQPLSFNVEYAVIAAQSEEDKKATDERVKKIASRLKKRGEFAKAAKEEGLAPKETGFFAENEPIPGIGWSPQITSLIDKAKTGEFLNPLLLEKNYYIIKVRERKEANIPALENIKEKVKESYLKDRSRALAEKKLKECLKKNPVNLEKNARICGLKSGSTDFFKYGSYIEGIGASDNFWAAAQKLKEGQLSEVIEAPSGFYVIRLKAKLPIDEKKFAAEKENFSQNLLAQKKQESFLSFTEELKKKAQKF